MRDIVHEIKIQTLDPKNNSNKSIHWLGGIGTDPDMRADLHLPPLLYLNLFIANRRIVIYL